MVFLKEFFEKVDFEINQQMTKRMQIFPACSECKISSICANKIMPVLNLKDPFSVANIILALAAQFQTFAGIQTKTDKFLRHNRNALL